MQLSKSDFPQRKVGRLKNIYTHLEPFFEIGICRSNLYELVVLKVALSISSIYLTYL